MIFYVVWNWCECYNIYSSLERATAAYKIMVQRAGDSCTEDGTDISEPKVLDRFSLINDDYFIFKVAEGETFGVEIRIDHKTTQDVILEAE